jgi:hypothetical protein
MNMDNYRGIAVTPVISKLCEYDILPTLAENFTQSTLQFRFTKGMSMLMAGFLICDTRAEAKYLTIEPLLLVTVDSQKAFDVVDHIIMLDTYYENTQNHPLWSVVKNLYTGLVSKVKWKGNTSNSFHLAMIAYLRNKMHKYSNQCSCTSNKRNVVPHSDHTSYIEFNYFLL